MSPAGSGLLAGALVLATVHGLMPNHWAPFVLIGRAQGWRRRRMLWVLLMAGIAHTSVAAGLSMVTLLLGVALAEVIEPVAHLLPGVILLATGTVYVALDLRKGEHHHHHANVHKAASSGMSDRTATTTLILTLALAPCEAMVPVFVGAAPMGDAVFLLTLAVLSGVASVAVMWLLAALAWSGARHLQFGWAAHHERLVVGLMLLGIGVLTITLGHFGHGGHGGHGG
jgi:hypothetical protein